jgi:1-acyl-sn-glycerol-3-phosphate acyltransferase
MSRVVVRLIAAIAFRAAINGTENFPRTGGGLVCANHQSYLDPLIVGMTCNREMCYVARATLYQSTVLRWLMTWYNTIPIRRDGLGLSAIKEILRRLRGGELVLIFPEGTRTDDGEIGELKSGFCAIVRRTKTPLIPVAIDGAYQVWPRDRKWPRIGKIGVFIGEPILADAMESLTDDELVAELSRQLLACHARARNSLG